MSTKKILVQDIARQLGINDKILTFRLSGKKAKDIILRYCKELLPGEALELDFQGIELSDISFIDEIIFEVQLSIRRGFDTMFFISNLNDTILELFDAAQALREKNDKRIPIIYWDNKQGFVIKGRLEENLHQTFKQLTIQNNITARDIAEHYRVAINSASNRLKKLYDYRLVMRKDEVDASGKQHIYMLPNR